jgi:hypothetical protein
MLGTPTRLNPMEIAQPPFNLIEMKIPVGDYSLIKISLGDETATIRGLKVTLRGPTQDL